MVDNKEFFEISETENGIGKQWDLLLSAIK